MAETFRWRSYIWMFPKIGVPPNHPFCRVFHYKPSILGYHHFRKHLYNNLPTNMIHSLSHWPLISSWSQAFRRFCHGDTLEAHRPAVKSALDPVESVGGRWWPRSTLQLDVFLKGRKLDAWMVWNFTWRFSFAKLETRNLWSPENQVGVYMSIVFFMFFFFGSDGVVGMDEGGYMPWLRAL